MNYSKTIINLLASANAVKIQSKLDSEFVLVDLGNAILDIGEGIGDIGEDLFTGDFQGLGETFSDIGSDIGSSVTNLGTGLLGSGLVTGVVSLGEDLIDVGEDIGDYVVSADGLIYDLAYIFSEDFGQDLLNVGEYVFTGELFVDGWDWMSEGSNWLALTNTLADTGSAVIQGNFGQAINIVTDLENYDGEAQMEAAYEAQYEAAYDEYVIQYNEEVVPMIAQYEELVERKAETCDTYEPAVGSTPYTMFGMEINYTQAISAQIGTTNMQTFYTYFTGSPTQEECEAADCLNPCYGAEHEQNCSLCLQIAFSAEAQAQVTQEQFHEICDACHVPPTEVEIPDLMSYEEFKQAVQDEQ